MIERIPHDVADDFYTFQLKKITDISKITDALNEASIEILDLQAVDTDLENVFLKLTGSKK